MALPSRQEMHAPRKRSATAARLQSQLPPDAALSGSGEALNLAVIYNQRRSNAMHEKRASFRRRLRSNDGATMPQLGGLSGESDVGNYDGDELPFWDAYDVVNQLYIELGKHKQTETQLRHAAHTLRLPLSLTLTLSTSLSLPLCTCCRQQGQHTESLPGAQAVHVAESDTTAAQALQHQRSVHAASSVPG